MSHRTNGCRAHRTSGRRERCKSSTYVRQTNSPEEDDPRAESPPPPDHHNPSLRSPRTDDLSVSFRHGVAAVSSLIGRKIEIARWVSRGDIRDRARSRHEMRSSFSSSSSSSSLSARVERARSRSVKDHPDFPDRPCRPSDEVFVSYLSLSFSFLLSRFHCLSAVPPVVYSRCRSQCSFSHSVVPYGAPRGIRAISMLAVPRPNQRLRRLETGRPYKSAAATTVEAATGRVGGPTAAAAATRGG